jgi:hypothetical protein
MSVGLQYPRPEESTAPMSVSELRYGGSESLAAREGRPLESGKSIELRLEKQDQDALGKFLSDTGYTVVTQINVRINEVMFSDGSRWAGGRLWTKTSRSPQDRDWSPVKESQPAERPLDVP